MNKSCSSDYFFLTWPSDIMICNKYLEWCIFLNFIDCIKKSVLSRLAVSCYPDVFNGFQCTKWFLILWISLHLSLHSWFCKFHCLWVGDDCMLRFSCVVQNSKLQAFIISWKSFVFCLSRCFWSHWFLRGLMF